jgi:hypothetical protein
MVTLAQAEAVARFAAGIVGYFEGKIEQVTVINENLILVWSSFNGRKEEIFKPNGEQI